MDRRGANYSDISMHAGCTSFPSCFSEGSDGSLVHVDNPSTVIRGKKEGSSPSKRKSFILTHLKLADFSKHWQRFR